MKEQITKNSIQHKSFKCQNESDQIPQQQLQQITSLVEKDIQLKSNPTWQTLLIDRIKSLLIQKNDPRKIFMMILNTKAMTNFYCIAKASDNLGQITYLLEITDLKNFLRDYPKEDVNKNPDFNKFNYVIFVDGFLEGKQKGNVSITVYNGSDLQKINNFIESILIAENLINSANNLNQKKDTFNRNDIIKPIKKESKKRLSPEREIEKKSHFKQLISKFLQSMTRFCKKRTNRK